MQSLIKQDMDPERVLTQVLYSTFVASVIASNRVIECIVTHESSICFLLRFVLPKAVAACLTVIVTGHICGQLWWDFRASRIFIIGLAMLVAVEMVWPLRCCSTEIIQRCWIRSSSLRSYSGTSSGLVLPT